MAKIDITKVEGFEELNRKLKKLPDNVKRREVLKIQRRVAKPIISKFSDELPEGETDKVRFGKRYPAGTLSKAVKADTVPARKSKGNPAIAIRPGKKGRFDAFYRFMVVPKGTKLSGNGRGSRKGKNTVVENVREKVINALGPQALNNYVQDTKDYIQKQINRLSK